MGQSLVITLREGLEAALIVAIILAYLRQMGYPKGIPAVWFGVAGAVALSLALAAVLFVLDRAFEGRGEEIFEGTALLLAVGVLGWMVVWMKNEAHHIKGRLEAQVQNAMHTGSSVALAGLAFVSVGREGLETALFLFAASKTATPMQTLTGGLVGLAIAIALGVAINRGSRRLQLGAFFKITGVLLIVIAAGLLARGIHELQEAAVIPILLEHVWDINHVLNDGTGAGGFMKGVLGYNGNPSLAEVIAYGMFLSATLTYFLWSPRVTARPPTSRHA